jgi:uncharacterized membrane-anchored protein
MTPLEFEQALDRWGADVGCWPPAEAARARAHLAEHPDARRLLEAAQRVETFLDELREHAPPTHLADRIRARAAAAGVDADPFERMFGWFIARLWRPALLALLVTTAGFITGMAVTDPVDPELAEDVMTLAFSDIYAELEDAQQ